MYLYSITLNETTAINLSIYGSFSKPNQHELVVAKGKILEMYKVDEETG